MRKSLETMTVKKTEDRLMKMAAKIKETYKPAEISQLVRLISPTPSTAEMSAEEFERLMQELEAKNSRRAYSPKSVEAARQVLVMGASHIEAAAATNMSRQAVNQLMLRIRRRMDSMPEGWIQITEWFPAEVAKQLAEFAQLLKASRAKGQQLDKPQSFTITLAGEQNHAG
ncbi:hypothetical protein PspP84CL_26190 [Pseudomonas syringae]|nr:hypothetical protein [Pseudomonas syringae]